MKKLASELVAKMSSLTALRSVEPAIRNTHSNLKYLGKTISDLERDTGYDRSGSAIVIGAGPSLHRQDSIKQILASDNKCDLVCADGALPTCLRSGLVPDYVVTVDPHPSRIVRWFGDPKLDEAALARDDYFTRQDLDPHLGEYELARNSQNIELVNKYGPQIKAVIATCASAAVTLRCLEVGMELYWWNPLYDDITNPDSLARRMHKLNKVPCMATGGNCGSAAWVFANVVLKKKEIALVGMDFSYAPGTSVGKTQYFKAMPACSITWDLHPESFSITFPQFCCPALHD